MSSNREALLILLMPLIGMPLLVLAYTRWPIIGILYLAASAIALFWLAIWPAIRPRPKPTGYAGKYRRPDGRVVHVGRLPNGTLMVASEEAPGVMPRDLGTVTGRELVTWTKLAGSPDGDRGSEPLGRIQDRVSGAE